MPIIVPIILGGIALASGAFGVKKGVDAHKHFKKAKNITNEAQTVFERGKSQLEAQRRMTKDKLERLGRLKLNIYDQDIRRFAESFRRIKNVDLTDMDLGGDLPVQKFLLQGVKQIDFKAVDAVKATVAGGGAGAIAGFVSFGAVGMLGTATTGTAIGSLSGAAAYSATMAWFGGGALGVGLGMTGGAYILGGVVAGPVLAVGGLVLDAKARSAVEDAKANLAKARKAVSEMQAAGSVARSIEVRAKQIHTLLEALRNRFKPMLEWLDGLLADKDDYRRFSMEEKKQLMITASTVMTMKNIIDAPLFDAKGMLDLKSKTALDDGNKLLTTLGSDA